MNQRPILEIRARIPGTGNFYIEYYYAIDVNGHLVVLDTSAIDTTLARLLPNGFSVLKGGGLQMETLQFTAPVWKPNDAHSDPTGGRVHMELAISNATLTVIESEYDAAYIWE